MRTIKLCASPTARPTTLLEAIRRSAVELEGSGRIRRLPLVPQHPDTATASA